MTKLSEVLMHNYIKFPPNQSEVQIVIDKPFIDEPRLWDKLKQAIRAVEAAGFSTKTVTFRDKHNVHAINSPVTISYSLIITRN